MDDYIFRRELDFQTELPEMIVQLKKDRQFRKMDLATEKELYDEYYALKKIFLSDFISSKEKRDIENPASQQILDRAQQEWEKSI